MPAKLPIVHSQTSSPQPLSRQEKDRIVQQGVNHLIRRVVLVAAAFFLNLASFVFFPIEVALATLAITVISGIAFLAHEREKENFSRFCTKATSRHFQAHPPLPSSHFSSRPFDETSAFGTASAIVRDLPTNRTGQRYVAASDDFPSNTFPGQGHVHRPPASSGTASVPTLPIRGLPTVGQAPSFPSPAPASNTIPGQGHVAAPSFSPASSNIIPGQGHVTFPPN